MIRSHRSRLTVYALLLTLAGSCTSFKKPPSEIPPDYRDAPLFYERLDPRDYDDTENLELMLRDSLTLSPIGTERIEGFDWVHHERRDKSWWLRMERFEYLVPLIASGEQRHRDFLRRWVEGFLDAHERESHPNVGSYDGMAIGIRVMVLAWYLKILTEADPEDVLIERITNHVRWTQSYLAEPENFSMGSNHALPASLGLFETTRVLPDSALAGTALDRVYRVVRESVSDQGFHREHSPAYHFFVHGWVSRIVDYFSILGDMAWDRQAELEETDRKMRDVAYYLYDHGMRVPTIGDTDATQVAGEYARAPRRPQPDAVYDPEAGYAIFKDPTTSPFQRYVVFNNQNAKSPPTMIQHFHDDVLSVFYSDGGETILGDQGRYSYSLSLTRRYFKSRSAHNTIFVREEPLGPLRLAGETWWEEGPGRYVFAATSDGKVRRRVVIPRSEPGITVLDSLAAGPPRVIVWNIGLDVERFEQLSPREVDGASIFSWEMATRTGRPFFLTITITGPNRSEQTTLFGQEDPMLGWYSPSYNVIVPIHVIKLDVEPLGDVLVSTNVVAVSSGDSSTGQR